MFSGFDTIELASSQEKYAEIYKAGQGITPQQLVELKKCLWVRLATKLAPSNLVLRQWALIDLFSGLPDHKEGILEMFDVLSYKQDDNGMRIWSEGHYYFWYAMEIVQLWVDKYASVTSLDSLKNLIKKIRMGLTATAYIREGVLYGAPYGDIRDVPLASPIPDLIRKSHVKVSIITMDEEAGNVLQYNIKGKPIKFNLHIPKNDCKQTVVDGIPIGFQFYDGWDKKYKNKWEEIKDMLSLKRLKSFF
jgi:hypothetical protein